MRELTIAVENAERKLNDWERKLDAAHNTGGPNELSWTHGQFRRQSARIGKESVKENCTTFRDLVARELERQLDVLQVVLHVEVKFKKVVPRHNFLCKSIRHKFRTCKNEHHRLHIA